MKHTVLVLALLAATVVPALAKTQCGSDQNLWHVHRRIEGVIQQLQHDQRDYGGHRTNAVNDLNAARAQIVASEQYAVSSYHDDPACFQTTGPNGAPSGQGERGQMGSNANLTNLQTWIGRLITQLQNDNRDYGGHKAQAISNLQAAQGEIGAALQWQQSH